VWIDLEDFSNEFNDAPYYKHEASFIALNDSVIKSGIYPLIKQYRLVAPATEGNDEFPILPGD